MGKPDQDAATIVIDGRCGVAPIADARSQDWIAPRRLRLAASDGQHRNDLARRRARPPGIGLFGAIGLEAERERHGGPARLRLAAVGAQVRPKPRPRSVDHAEAEPSIRRNLGVGDEACGWQVELGHRGILRQTQIDDARMVRRQALRAHRLGIRRRCCDHRPQAGDKEPPSHGLGSLPISRR